MFFSFSFASWGQIFGVFFAPLPEEEISDYIAHGPIIRVLTVMSWEHWGAILWGSATGIGINLVNFGLSPQPYAGYERAKTHTSLS